MPATRTRTTLYNDEDRPPANADGQAILHVPSGAGDSDAVHLELHSGDSREVVLKLGDGLTVSLKDDDPVVSIEIDGGNATLTIARDGALHVESQGDINLKGNSSINIEASGELNLKGSVVNLN